MEPQGWRSRNYLPHLDNPDRIQVLTIRLADSIPKRAIEQIEAEVRGFPEEKRESEHRRRVEKWLDKGHGACWLRRPDCANVVEQALLAGDGVDYILIEWVIMPNHVHALVKLRDGYSLSDLFKTWKGPTALYCNRLVGRSGTFWFREYHDRFIRNEAHFTNAVAYIRQNPLKAGLCVEARAWPYGSARYAE
jgi:REP element-mobilizing transposase RayT